MIISIPLPFEVLTVWLVIFKGSIFHKFALISNIKEVIFTNFCYGQYLQSISRFYIS